MTRDFKEALRHRRTYYHITNSSPISDEQIKEIIDFAVMNVPSAFNSQSTRIVLLLGKNHKKLWEITKETLKMDMRKAGARRTASLWNLTAVRLPKSMPEK